MNGFKVRAWDKVSKKYREVDSIVFHGPGCFDNGPRGELKLVTMWGRDIIEDKDIIVQRMTKDVELEWAIGEKDRHDKDVFAGDVLDVCYSEGQRAKVVVFYDRHYFSAFCVETPNGAVHVLGAMALAELDAYVIGNVHENPEMVPK